MADNAQCQNCNRSDCCKSCGGCNACGCGCDSCCNECRPRTRRIIEHKMDISDDTAATCFAPTLCNFTRSADISKLSAWVRPRGTFDWKLTYDAFDRDDMGRVCFRWDHQLFELGKPRLEVEFRTSNGLLPPTYVVCGRMELRIVTRCALDLFSAVNVPHKDGQPAATETVPGVHPVFDDLLGFSGSLCSILEASGTFLSLCTDGLVVLCGVTLCRPVQLQISDGVNIEYVQFAGCVSGIANVLRGQNNTTPRRFPVGSTVVFTWTAFNVTAATEGC